MKVDTYFFNTGEKLCTFALSPIVVEKPQSEQYDIGHQKQKSKIIVIFRRGTSAAMPL